MSNVAQLKVAATIHNRLREQLSIAFGLDGDDEALRGTLEGESDFNELCARAARQALWREAQAKACDPLIADMQQRQARHIKAAKAIRGAIAEAMLDAGEKKITAPDMTLSALTLRPRLEWDDKRLPDTFFDTVTTRKPNRDRIQASVDTGDVPEGVTITNGGASLKVFPK